MQSETEKPTETLVSKKESLDWREICGQRLAEQQLTTSSFTNADGVTPQLDKVYQRLSLEYKPPKPRSRSLLEEKEDEKSISIAEERFLEEVLRLGQSSSLGRRIAVIGEPGSGKTTRLQKIAAWILEQGLGLPIWVSLADLTQPTIAQYIEEFWLKQTGQSLTIEALTQQKDQIWLLLDGVDEMTSRVETRHVSALLGGWLQAVRVVVSCRVNVWEADKNAFSGFDVFRNLEFSPEQVQDYIRCWFAGAGDGATGEDLDRALSQSDNYRLKELIQNPLRLWMLCHIWYRNRGGLPETQAELYGQFVDRVYDWKADENILDQREAINAALAKLALAAMEQQDEVSRFRLRESWVVKKLGSRQIFEAVKRLGWLNRVERSSEVAYVFYHSTFQEYFAALGVESWNNFLPKDHKNSPVEGKYRIFEPQWKQVILLWLGREDIADEKKEEFINKLVSFDTGCDDGNFYCYRAYFLAAEGITQYADFTPFDEVTNPQNYLLVDIVISQLIEWAVGYIDANDQKYNYLYPLKEGAITALRITKKTKVIEYLMHGLEMMLSSDECSDEMINYSPGKEELIREYAILLSEFTPDEKIVIEVLLFRNLGTAEGEFTSRQTMDDWDRPPSLTAQELIKLASTLVSISESPDKISQEKIQLEDYFVSRLEITEDESERRAAAEYLGETAQGNTQVIRELERILKNPRNTDVYRWAAYSLGKTDPGNLNAIAAIVYILENPKDKNISKWAIEVLSEIAQGNDQAITALVLMSDTTRTYAREILRDGFLSC